MKPNIAMAGSGGAQMGHDVLLVEGIKPGFRTAREIYVRKMWIIDPS